MSATLAAVLAGVGGLILGSFLNVVAHRLPRDESLATPGSRCPGCGAPVRPHHNVPVVSWLLLRGRCASCRAPISRRYPVVEALTAVLFAAVVLVHHGDAAAIALGLVLVALLVPIALIDLDGQPERLIAAVAAGGFLFVAAWLYPRGMGMGDVKLAGMLGLFLGGEVAVAMLVALVSGVAVGIAVMARLGTAAGRKTAVPFGPFLALGGVVALLVGEPLLDLYLDTLR